MQAATPANRRYFYWHPHSQLWKTKSSLKTVFSIWTEKAISKYRPVATISKKDWRLILAKNTEKILPTTHNDNPNNRTHIIKFRVTEKEKLTLELCCKRLNISISTLIRQSLLEKPVQHIVLVAGGGEDALNVLSALLGQCGKIGSNLNQLARHFNTGGKDSEQIRAQILTELSALTLFRLNAEKTIGELYGNHQAYKLEEL